MSKQTDEQPASSGEQPPRRYWQRVDEVFNAVVESPPHMRTTCLESLCGSDDSLRSDVSRLLDSDERMQEGFLEPPAIIHPSPSSSTAIDAAAQADLVSAQRWIGREIRGFTLTRCIAVGGMGAVYEAVQDRPRRTVALKLLRGALHSAPQLRRFVTEAEILADLHHPNIAHVYEAGTGDGGPDGAPYIVLELIPQAASLTEFVRERKLDRRTRLDLFLQVCDAVQHVHQRGVIHRDLKPANILVDAGGRLKVIDFGIARFVDPDLAAATRVTVERQIVGTLAYMCPEQLRGDAAHADTRSDVYALGVILFELLTGRLPYEVQGRTLAESIRAIEHATPPRPSSFDRSLRGDLDTIVLKSMEKQPERRYSSVEALSEDIRRFLGGRPINARSPTLVYQLTRLAGRHKAAAILAGCLAAACVLFGLAMTNLYLHAEGNRRAAEESKQRAETAQRDVQESNEHLRQRFEALQAVLRVLSPHSDRPPDEEAGSDDGHTSLEMLDRSTAALRERLRNDPWGLANLMLDLARLYDHHGHCTRSATLAEEALALYRRVPGFDAATECNLLRQVAYFWMAAGVLPRAASRIDQAVGVAERSLAPDHPLALNALSVRAEIDLRRSDFGAARAGCEEALRRIGAPNTGNSLRVAEYQSRLAMIADQSGDRSAAIEHARQAFALREAALGPDDHQTKAANAQFRRVSIPPDEREPTDAVWGMVQRGRCAEAEQLALDQLESQRAQYGADSPRELLPMQTLGRVRQLRGNLGGALAVQRNALALERRLYSAERPDRVCGALFEVAALLWVRGELGAADGIHEEALSFYKRCASSAADDSLLHGAPLLLGLIELERRNAARAEELFRECLEVRRRFYAAGHHLVVYAEGLLALALVRQERFDEAAALAQRAYAGCTATWGPLSVRTHDLARILVELHERCGDEPQAVVWRKRLQACGE
jgi:serine/threonine protein kinase/tetratricopeptide (TPR) repeat protein